ncbi:MAG: pseudouridine-5'-phosphate glycosidase, partial [Alphaproteobacteria bacterium]|nr:pseudouridine-5'-phosphate glycosidase [Alphaproteobacteria bacterium]
VLETQGVPVLGYRTDRLPAFHCRDSGLPVDAALEGPQAAARVARAHWARGLGGLLVCNPVPEEAAIPADEVAAWVDAALAAAEQDGIAGKEVTPYLLRHIASVSGGRSL